MKKTKQNYSAGIAHLNKGIKDHSYCQQVAIAQPIHMQKPADVKIVSTQYVVLPKFGQGWREGELHTGTCEEEAIVTGGNMWCLPSYLAAGFSVFC